MGVSVLTPTLTLSGMSTKAMATATVQSNGSINVARGPRLRSGEREHRATQRLDWCRHRSARSRQRLHRCGQSVERSRVARRPPRNVVGSVRDDDGLPGRTLRRGPHDEERGRAGVCLGHGHRHDGRRKLRSRRRRAGHVRVRRSRGRGELDAVTADHHDDHDVREYDEHEPDNDDRRPRPPHLARHYRAPLSRRSCCRRRSRPRRGRRRRPPATPRPRRPCARRRRTRRPRCRRHTCPRRSTVLRSRPARRSSTSCATSEVP